MASIKIKSDIVMKACEDYLKFRREYIAEKREEIIQKQLKRWFFRPKSREEAIAQLEKSDLFSRYHLLALIDCTGRDEAMNIWHLANKADEMTLYHEDLERLGKFLEEE